MILDRITLIVKYEQTPTWAWYDPLAIVLKLTTVRFLGSCSAQVKGENTGKKKYHMKQNHHFVTHHVTLKSTPLTSGFWPEDGNVGGAFCPNLCLSTKPNCGRSFWRLFGMSGMITRTAVKKITLGRNFRQRNNKRVLPSVHLMLVLSKQRNTGKDSPLKAFKRDVEVNALPP